MSISANIQQTLSRFEPGQVFGYRDIPLYPSAPNTVIQTVRRLVAANKLKKLAKGQFYLPRKGLLGDRKPSEQELLRTVLYRDGKLRGYITGPALFNRLGLTTQVPKTITIATSAARQNKDLGTIRIKMIKARAPIIANDVTLLQYLDVLKDCKKIPDASVDDVLNTMLKKITLLTNKELDQMQRLALEYYPASTKAVLGMLIESGQRKPLRSLYSSLNPITRYTIGVTSSRWPEKENWNIQ